MNRQRRIAEFMLDSGEWYTPATLGKAFGVSARVAGGYLYNLRMSKLYQTEETPKPGRKVKVTAIGGRKLSQSKLWSLALGVGKNLIAADMTDRRTKQ